MRFIKRILLPLSFLGITLITPACGGDFCKEDCDEIEDDGGYGSSNSNDSDVGYYDCYTIQDGSWYTDNDGDGWSEDEGDCNDGWEGTNPDAPGEWRDGEDNDCDCWVDEDCEGAGHDQPC